MFVTKIMLHIIYIQLKHENKRLLNKIGGKYNDYSGHCTSSLSLSNTTSWKWAVSIIRCMEGNDSTQLGPSERFSDQVKLFLTAQEAQ